MLSKIRFSNSTKCSMKRFSALTYCKATNFVKNSASYALNNLPQTSLTTNKDTGLRVVSENWNTKTTTIKLHMDVGCRYETNENAGISHFLEHMAFKGTHNRTIDDIEKQACEKGAYLQADTSRESNTYSLTVLNKDVSWAIELLSEIVTNTKFDSNLVEKEKAIILREIEQSQLDYKGITMDYLHATAFQGTPLHRPIYGLPDSLKKLTAEDLANFVALKFRAPKTVISVVGGVDHSHIVTLTDKYFAHLGANYTSGEIPIRWNCRFTGSEIRDRDDEIPLVHVALAIEGPDVADEDCIVLKLASLIHGSWDCETGGGINNASELARRSFANVNRDVKAFDNFFIQYHDTSLWGVYYTVKRDNCDEWSGAFPKEWMYLANTNYKFQLQRAKNTLKTQILRELNSNDNIATKMAQEVVHYGRRLPISEMFYRIDMVTGEHMKDTVYKYVYDRCPAVAAFGPTGGILDYNIIREKMWWYRV